MELSKSEIIARIEKLRKETWKFLKEAKLDFCFDCDKPLTEKEGIVCYDSKGLEVFCLDHSWTKIYVREFWTKVFQE